MNKRITIYSIIILILDQITKSIIQTYETNITVIKNVFSITYVQNKGASWGILEGKTTLLIIITIVMLVLIYNMMFSYKNVKYNNLIFGLLFGGILGNFIDRIFFSYVRDFISVGNFPVFNIADSAIVIGIFLLIIVSIKGEIKSGDSSKSGRKRKNR